MDRHIFVAAPYNGPGDTEATLSVYYDINSGHYECFLDQDLVAVIHADSAGRWTDVRTGETSALISAAGKLIDKRLAE